MIQTLRNSALVKVLALVALILLLCIPLAEIGSLIRERGQSQAEAAQELASTHATETERNSKGEVTGQSQRTKQRTAIVFPERLKIDGRMTPEERYRGIFRVLFYKLDATLEGRFAAFGPAPRPSERGGTVTLGTPRLAFSVSDVRGIEGLPDATLGGAPLRFQQGIPGLGASASSQGIHAPLSGEALRALASGQAMDFRLALKLVGQEQLRIVPAAEDTEAHLQSPWPHPSFGGRFLASERTVGDAGFDARWRVSALVSTARTQLLRQWAGEAAAPPADVACAGDDSACRVAATAASAAQTAQAAPARADLREVDSFDVALAQPVNVYFMAHRAAKYGALFIGLVLMASFMFELFRQLRLHPVQYGLVGLSVALFFLLLVALSEKLTFWQAYALSACASVLLLMAYFSAVLRGWRRGVGLGAFVAVLYGALYGLLASENNALLLGALLTFGMLALLMLVTRNVDWYALSEGRARPAEPAAATGPTLSN
ncbi:MAG: cell envelope integrity protein CreD [Variovorax paradoxus]|uniref:Cell envelope integrity protein CreD n=1 Tax=Variovorax paradoxus TaxID=34073 RepID=A0A2W5PUC0_VARPD|nr:MAG: cell envelope integrity protein CreD [Variovorax paradoxus]